jgi:hypothetical protein
VPVLIVAAVVRLFQTTSCVCRVLSSLSLLLQHMAVINVDGHRVLVGVVDVASSYRVASGETKRCLWTVPVLAATTTFRDDIVQAADAALKVNDSER